MLKHARVGLIVWGSIILVISLISIIAIASDYGFDSSDSSMLLVFIILIMLGGAMMLIFGIINAVKTANYNRDILNQNIIYYGFCPHCGTRLDCTIRDFRPHSRYPEGYVQCKVCKQPVSRNAFETTVGR